MDDELTEEEKRHLRALKLFYEVHGMHDLEKRIDEMPPGVQRLAITTYHTWLEHPEEFGALWKQAHRFSVIGRFWNWVRRIFA